MSKSVVHLRWQLRHFRFQDIPPPLESVAFFRVVNVEHNLLSDPASPPDNHFASTMGEFGCWMDPSSTRLIQVGVENARVPGLGSITGKL